ncbi:LPS export ABC transporter periplasmic protein LptC [Methyloligella sp. 2.7D]|uniref:LPS export ABC transporter periplasmic protein LptC n=1 Tax=unclassified Methyloligella TaxID=2625955 RepID=UPI00157C9E16|nr:LPS export ABC transporter periplasmic protein LptC [Methyloligella sp. GL2]QKP76075.1 LPS export ABC transporter periplasmic protein LptC [Methyloligella sp. GL2]
MSTQAYNAPQQHEGLRFRTEAERAKAFVNASRHSRLVRILRFGLPGFAVLMTLGYFISSSMSVTVGDVTASISGVEVNDGVLRMTNPTMKGVDKKNGAYTITAEYADQNVKTPKIIELHAITADLKNGPDGWSRMTADRGTYDSEKETLVMKDRIDISTSTGITGAMTYAEMDLKEQLLHSPVPVLFETESGTVRSKEMTWRSDKKTLEFKGDVRVHLTPKKAPGEDAPAAAPQVAEETAPPPAPERRPSVLPTPQTGLGFAPTDPAAQGAAGRLP